MNRKTRSPIPGGTFLLTLAVCRKRTCRSLPVHRPTLGYLTLADTLAMASFDADRGMRHLLPRREIGLLAV